MKIRILSFFLITSMCSAGMVADFEGTSPLSDWHNANGFATAIDPSEGTNTVLDTSGRGGNSLTGVAIDPVIASAGTGTLTFRFHLRDSSGADLSVGLTATADLAGISGSDATFFGPLIRLVDGKVQIYEGNGSGGGTYLDADQAVTPATWYTVTMTADNGSNAWSGTIEGGAYAASTPLTHSGSATSFGFRTGGSDGLVNFVMRANTANGTPGALLDDVSPVAESASPPPDPDPELADGYKGIWFNLGQNSTYGPKYSGGLATYTAKHRPLAVYAPEVDKTFFTYGGAPSTGASDLRIMASWYDHANHLVPKPTQVMDRNTGDPHDNAAIQLDRDGHVWIFVSARNTSRPSSVYRSDQPYSTASFTEISPVNLGNQNAYPQILYIPGSGPGDERFFFFFTRYTGGRQLYFSSSSDGITWAPVRKLAGFGGHYQVSNHFGNRVGTAFNQHGDGGVDNRTDLNYLQSDDYGATWTTADGTPLSIPLNSSSSPARIIDYRSQQLLVYVKDLVFDDNGYPVIFYLTANDASGNGHQPGPNGEPRLMRVTRWTGGAWETTSMPPAATAQSTVIHNYSMGSLSVDGTTWTAVIPSGAGEAPGPGASKAEIERYWGQGGEMETWQSTDFGQSWTKVRTITRDSPRKHGYARNVFGGADPFFTLWADGNPEASTEVHLYFANRLGTQYWELPYNMSTDTAAPEAGKAPYLRWQERFASPEAVSDGTDLQPGDNPDGDPANNELEFIFGTDPFDGADFPGTTLSRGGTPASPTLVFSFTFNGEVEDYEISIEASDDLIQWDPATGLTETSRTIQPDGQVELEFTASQPFDSSTRRFYRLKIIGL